MERPRRAGGLETQQKSQEIAGEVLVANRADGAGFVQFTKTPFPMIIAQTTTNHWQIEIPVQNRRFSGPGSPPKRLIWAYLPGLLAGRPAPKGWSWTVKPDDAWRLENRRTGEKVEVTFRHRNEADVLLAVALVAGADRAGARAAAPGCGGARFASARSQGGSGTKALPGALRQLARIDDHRQSERFRNGRDRRAENRRGAAKRDEPRCLSDLGTALARASRASG